MNVPPTRYARSQDGAYIAYQVFGQGDVDLLWISPWFSHLELLWEHPPIARFHREMASFARLILLDQRGIGLSDRARGLPDLETRVDDLRAVLDAVGSERTVVWGAGPEFVQGIREEEAELDRVLATVLFTDIVDSTATAAVMGDAKWRKLIDEHDRLSKAIVLRYRGEYVESTGDGLLATFDGPARAVRCAQALGEAVKGLGVEIRAGAHTGEITRSESNVAGLGVHVAARVASMAGANEVWASSTVKDLTAGSGLAFDDAGEHELKGVPDRWRLYRVVG